MTKTICDDDDDDGDDDLIIKPAGAWLSGVRDRAADQGRLSGISLFPILMILSSKASHKVLLHLLTVNLIDHIFCMYQDFNQCNVMALGQITKEMLIPTFSFFLLQTSLG